MTIDVRARITCSAGKLISASLSDDYVQGNGLIKTTGSCELAGAYSLLPGDEVIFSYTKSGITRKIPKILRVLSSFIDPFRNITTVELGCKLTYLQDLTDPINWDAFDDSENADRIREETAVVTVPIHAKSIMKKCLDELGIVATSNPLTNVFSIPEFDFSSGYVSILSDLLLSECYCGYLNEKEQLVVIDLRADSADGPVVTSDMIIDVSPIGIGQLPGDAVVVKYSTLKLKAPDGSEKEEVPPTAGEQPVIQWGRDFDRSETKSDIAITWQSETQSGGTTAITDQYQVYSVLTTKETTTEYRLFKVENEDGTTTRKNLAIKKETIDTRSSIDVAANIASQYYANNIGFNIFPVQQRTVEKFEYNKYGEPLRNIKEVFASAVWIIGSLGIDYVFDDGVVSLLNTELSIGKTIEEFERSGNYEITRTQEYGTWDRTIRGQQAIALARKYLTTATKTGEFVDAIYALGLHLIDETISTGITGSRAEQAPLPEEITNAKDSDGTDSSNGYRTESKAEIELITGNTSAQRRIELSMPYTPDDTFAKIGDKYFARTSDAKIKARNFGRIQNRMLFGNRTGMSIQVSPELIPNQPFSSIFIESNGVVGLYKINGASWTMDENGIIASIDAMFWGAAGRIA